MKLYHNNHYSFLVVISINFSIYSFKIFSCLLCLFKWLQQNNSRLSSNDRTTNSMPKPREISISQNVLFSNTPEHAWCNHD